MNSKQSLIAATLLGALTVMIGAFGAHALRTILETTGRAETFETAVKYQMYHTLALLLAGIWQLYFPHKLLKTAGLFFLLGILIFSGSLYVLCLTGITVLGAITPIGGVLFIIGWFCLAGAAVKMPVKSS